MSLSWPAVVGTAINTAVGTLGAVGSGDFTIVALVNLNGANHGVIGLSASGSFEYQVLSDTGTWFGGGDFSGFTGTPGAPVVGDWQIIGLSKVSGSNVYRWHYWNYTTNSAKVHADGTGTHADPGTITGIQLGNSENRGNGLQAFIGVWKRVLSDAEFDAACTSNLSDWNALAPDALWPMNVAAASVVDVTGHGADATSVTGTISSAADPPGYNYALGGTQVPQRSGPSQEFLYKMFWMAIARRNSLAMDSGVTWPVDVTDSAGLTDSSVLDRTLVPTDSAGLTDSAILDRTLVQTDSVGLTDSAVLDRSLTQTDSAGLTDSSTVELFKLIAQTDSAGLTDAAVLDRALVATDSAGLTDSAILDRSSVVTDSAGLTDSSALELAKIVTQTDSAGLTDSSALTRSNVVTDSAGLTDTSEIIQSKVVTDSAGLTDSGAVQLVKLVTATDSAGLTDTAPLSQAKVQTDSAGLTDSQVFQSFRVITDSAGLTDSIAPSFSRSLTDSAGLTDTWVTPLSIGRTIDDLAGLTDSLAMTGSFSRTFTDSAGLTDDFEAGLDALPATLLPAPSGTVDFRSQRGSVDIGGLGSVDLAPINNS